jgi:hypothetical protein
MLHALRQSEIVKKELEKRRKNLKSSDSDIFTITLEFIMLYRVDSHTPDDYMKIVSQTDMYNKHGNEYSELLEILFERYAFE